MSSEDYRALIEEARIWPREGVNEGPLINDLADAVEDLVAENAKLLEAMSLVRAEAITKTVHQRDALQAQLDGMTTEWGTENLESKFGPDRDVWETEADARWSAKEYGETLIQRRVGPWVEVSE